MLVPALCLKNIDFGVCVPTCDKVKTFPGALKTYASGRFAAGVPKATLLCGFAPKCVSEKGPCKGFSPVISSFKWLLDIFKLCFTLGKSLPAEDDTTFKEYKFSQANINEFTSFQLKIVMKGTNSSYPPIIRDMRGIALAV